MGQVRFDQLLARNVPSRPDALHNRLDNAVRGADAHGTSSTAPPPPRTCGAANSLGRLPHLALLPHVGTCHLSVPHEARHAPTAWIRGTFSEGVKPQSSGSVALGTANAFEDFVGQCCCIIIDAQFPTALSLRDVQILPRHSEASA